MKWMATVAILLLICRVSPGQVHAQANLHEIGGSSDIKTGTQVARIPFSTDGTHLYIKVQTLNSPPLNFIFDTGTTGAMIDSATAMHLGIDLRNASTVDVGGIGGLEHNVIVPNQVLKVGNAELKGLNLVLSNFTALNQGMGSHLDGLLGYEVMNRYVTQIDFDLKEILLYDKISDVATDGYTAVAFDFYKSVNIPRFPVSLTLDNGQSFSGLVMFDTGNAFPLLVSAPFSKFHNLNELVGPYFPAWGLNPNEPDKVASVRSVSFNGFSFGPMSIRLTGNDHAAPKDGALGILGIEVIRRFNVILDYANKKIWLKPNSNYAVPFQFEKATADQLQEGKMMAAGAKFLAGQLAKPGVKSLASGLLYEVMTPGTGAPVKVTDKVTLYYSLTLMDGTKLWKPFDAGNPWEHHLDKALTGIRQAVLMMPVGAKWRLYLPAELAFGFGDYYGVPPYSVVICELEVVKAVAQ